MNKLRLTIGYSSIAERVDKINFPEKRPQTEILVAVQGGLTREPDRADIRMIYLDTFGAAKSRNVILQEANSEFVVFGDDDMEWKEDGLSEIVDQFDRNKNLDLILCQSENEHNQLRKKYPKRQTHLSKFNSAKAATYEIAIRLSSFREKKIFFHEDFGAGTKNYIGDEYIFISEACDSGLDCEFIPITIAVHPEVSSGMIYGTLRDSQARSNVFRAVFGKFAIIARAGFVLKNPLRIGSPVLALRFIFGIFAKDT